MASIDVTTRALWATKEPALGLLTTVACARAACVGLEDEDRAPFEALSTAILAWWPARKRSPEDLYENEFKACLSAREKGEHLRLALDAAYLEMAALLKLDPRPLANDAIYKLSEDDFVALVRRLAKFGHTDLELWKARFSAIAESPKRTWPELVKSVERMGFARDLSGLRNLPEPLQGLARLADLGAIHSWSMMGTKHALRLELGTNKRIVPLDEHQRADLLEVNPWLA